MESAKPHAVALPHLHAPHVGADAATAARAWGIGAWMVTAFLIGTAGRLWVASQSASPPAYAVDRLFDTLAWNIVQGLGFTWDGVHPAAHVGPLYPAVLAGWYSLLGHRPETIPLLHAVFDLATAAVLFLAGRALAGPRAGALAASLYFCYPAYWTYDVRLRTESILTWLVAACVWSAVRAQRTARRRDYALAGGLAGAAILCKPVVLPIVALLAPLPFVAGHRGRAAWSQLGVSMLCTLLVVLPWTARNVHKFGRVIPVSAGMGAGLWAGSDSDTGGIWPMPAERETALWAGAGLIPLRHPYVMFEVDVDRALTTKALDRIADDPLAYAGLTAARLIPLWIGNRYYLSGSSSELSDGMAQDIEARGWWTAAYSVLKRIALMPVLLMTSAWALWSARGAWRRLWPLCAPPLGLTLGYLPFAVESGRYTLPVLPCLFVLTAAVLLGRPLLTDLSKRERSAA